MWFGEHASPEQMPVVSGHTGAAWVKGHGQVAVREGRRWVEPPQEHERVTEAR